MEWVEPVPRLAPLVVVLQHPLEALDIGLLNQGRKLSLVFGVGDAELVRVVPGLPSFLPEPNLVISRSDRRFTVLLGVALILDRGMNLSFFAAVYSFQLLSEVGLLKFSDVAEENVDVLQQQFAIMGQVPFKTWQNTPVDRDYSV